MTRTVSIERIGTTKPLRLTIAEGEVLFVVGPNGTGKSSLVNVLASNFCGTARVSWAHRQNIVYGSTIAVTASERSDIADLVRSWDIDRQARFWDNYLDRRPRAALFDLINASDTLSRNIARAVRGNDQGALATLGSQPDPIEELNGIFKAAALPIVLKVSDKQELQARKRDSVWFPAGELSDGERSATLLAADILGAPRGTLFLIDEPERHLHRSIAAPLLKELFASRPDCTFVITTHDLSLVLEHAGRRVLLLRDCVFDKGGGARWDLDILETNAPIDDELKTTILGSRSALLFVEGDTRSLDMGLYRILFPSITVHARGGSRDVVATVRSLRAIETLHWLDAFGIVDGDGRSEDDIARLKSDGIWVLPVCTVESLYYHPDVIRLIAEQQGKNLGAEGGELAQEAERRAFAALRQERERLIVARCKSEVEMQTLGKIWEGCGPWQLSRIDLPINPHAILVEEGKLFDQLIGDKDLVSLVARYGIKNTGFGAGVASALRFQKAAHYPQAVCARLKADDAARKAVITLFGDLPHALSEATKPDRRAKRASRNSENTTVG